MSLKELQSSLYFLEYVHVGQQMLHHSEIGEFKEGHNPLHNDKLETSFRFGQ